MRLFGYLRSFLSYHLTIGIEPPLITERYLSVRLVFIDVLVKNVHLLYLTLPLRSAFGRIQADVVPAASFAATGLNFISPFSADTRTVCPLAISPSRSFTARAFWMSDWIARLSGLAP